MRNPFLIGILIALFAACSKDTRHPVPDIPIYVNPIFVYDAQYNNLLNPYGKVIVLNTGYMNNGILVVNIGNNEFKAYDATCVYEIKQGCAITPDNGSISLVECPCCGSKYEVTFGGVSKGPANYSLKTYKTVFDGEYIRIYN